MSIWDYLTLDTKLQKLIMIIKLLIADDSSLVVVFIHTDIDTEIVKLTRIVTSLTSISCWALVSLRLSSSRSASFLSSTKLFIFFSSRCVLSSSSDVEWSFSHFDSYLSFVRRSCSLNAFASSLMRWTITGASFSWWSYLVSSRSWNMADHLTWHQIYITLISSSYLSTFKRNFALLLPQLSAKYAEYETWWKETAQRYPII